MYLLGIAYLGLICILSKEFVATRPVAWKEPFLNVNPTLAYISGGLLIITALLGLLNKYKAPALMTIAFVFFILATLRHLFYTHWQDDINGYKSLLLIGGAFLILSRTQFDSVIRKYIFWINIILIALFFAKCAYTHYKFPDFVKELIPTFYPFRLFFAYFAGACLGLAAIGLSIPKTQKLAALLSGIMISAWLFMLHIPRAVMLTLSENIGVGESCAIAGILFMIYGILIGESLSKTNAIDINKLTILK